MRCTANSKRTGQRCGAQAITGRTTCRHHGGRSLVGSAHPNYRHGSFSRVLPERLLPRYLDSLSDPNALELRHELAVVDTLLNDAITKLDTGDPALVLSQVRVVHRALSAAMKAGNIAAARRALVELDSVLAQDADANAAADRVRSLIVDRTKLVDAERRRLVDAQQMVSSTEVMVLVSALVRAVRLAVRDEAVIDTIADQFEQLLGKRIDFEPDGGFHA